MSGPSRSPERAPPRPIHEAWRGLYSDSDGSETEVVRPSPQQLSTASKAKAAAPPPTAEASSAGYTKRGAEKADNRGLIPTATPAASSSALPSPRIAQAPQEVRALPSVQTPQPPRISDWRAVLEPDSSSDDEACRARSAEKLPAPPAGSPSQKASKLRRLPALHSVVGPDRPGQSGPAGLLEDEDETCPAEPASPAQPPAAGVRQPQEVSPPSAGKLSGAAKGLAEFPGPDPDGLVPRWSQGALVLSGGALLPAQIASCLRPYQREGVRWLYERLFVQRRGALLTDEMGLGKTVQVACCLAAGLYATPSAPASPPKLREGVDLQAAASSSAGTNSCPPGPVLILCPPSLIQNWIRELRRWGPFAVEALPPSSGAPGGRLRALQRLDAGLTDVLVASRGLLQPRGADGEGAAGAPESLSSRAWGCIVVDEVHQAKNPKGQLHRALVEIACPRMLGLTGTPLQNSLSDVWSLLRVVGAHEGLDLSTFESRFARPIGRGQKRKATVQELHIREESLVAFRELMSRACLRRTKDDVALELPGKNDRIVPCPLSYVQHTAYRNLLDSPDWQMALGKRPLCICGAGRPCYCGAGPVWRYIHQRQAESKGLEDIWAAADECSCRGRNHPKCLSFSLIVLLQRVTNHLEQLKPESTPPRDSAEAAQQEFMRELCDVAFAGCDHNLCTNRRIANRLLLGSPEACGKMQILLPLLRHWRRKGHKILIFSRSTQLLDILEACLWQQGLSPQVLRLDGGTAHAQRQRLVDEFNMSSTRAIFLISTRAGGVGLNLTAASVVVIFDPDWNPCADLQAQDRSFRIGQTRVVEVYRLLGAGTIEEQIYIRQVWKQQLSSTAIDGTRSARRLDDSTFGLGTLFELHDSSQLPHLMAEACTAASSCRSVQQPSPVEEVSEGGVRVFRDLRTGGAGRAAAKISDLWTAAESESDREDGSQSEHDGGEAADGACSGDEVLGALRQQLRKRRRKSRPQPEAGICDKRREVRRPDVERKEEEHSSTQELHGMFDQLDHAKVVRNDTQENMLLQDLELMEP
eukprot:gnl/TRDRNA2_/TRDRNA2_161177_c0_seq1.p1 gnl/TRDRNA2_/TRDRNA2_161177_c0~~gnl/TRDRNA2_/TRDRNA2_161177_c0_seq1.p1  ORF type:complete len:1039 (+),score=163.59 gnl/TRDRNA2_/TRDRNA2_161177_c0_seq1:40-3156(+)